MKKGLLLPFFAVILSLSPALGQEEFDFGGEPEHYDSGFVKLMEDSLVLRVFTIQKINSLLIRDINDNNQLILKPNENTNLGFGFNYKWLGLNLAFNFPFINNDDHIYGESSSFNFLLYAYPRKFGLNVFFQSIQGYYVENMGEFDPTYNPNVIYQRPDISTGAVGGSFFYIFNHKKYSYRSVNVQNEIQTKSAGSFFLGGAISFVGINADSSIVPTNILNQFDSGTHITEANYNELGVFGGYSANIVFLKHMFLTFSLTPGFSFQGGTIQTLNSEYENRDRRPIAGSARATIGLGYNKDRWYLGLNTAVSTLNLGKSLSYQYGRVVFVFAYRFRPPNFVKKVIPDKLFGH